MHNFIYPILVLLVAGAAYLSQIIQRPEMPVAAIIITLTLMLGCIIAAMFLPPTPLRISASDVLTAAKKANLTAEQTKNVIWYFKYANQMSQREHDKALKLFKQKYLN